MADWEDAPTATGDKPWEDAPSQYAKFMRDQSVPRRTPLQGIRQGAADLIYGGAQIGARMGREEGDLLTPQEDLQQRQAVVDRTIKEREARIQASRPIEYAPLTYQEREQERQGIHPTRTPVERGIDVPRLVGNIGATLPLSALGPGAASGTIPRLLASAGTGALAASLNPVTEGDFTTEKVKQALGGALGGAVATGGGSVAGKLISAGEKAAPNVGAIAAREAGYVLPPATITERPGAVANTLAAWGGKIKTAQKASVKNQAVTNDLAVEELGLPKDTLLTESVFEGIRAKAGQVYSAIERSGVPIRRDGAFLDDVTRMGPASSEMAKHFPVTAKNDMISALQDELLGDGSPVSPQAAIQMVRRLRYKASSNLKNFADPDKVELGMAQRKAADAMDDLVERNLTASGRPDLVNEYKAARKIIAKSHDVESATNTASGDVDARALARLAARGRPLTGNLSTIANAAEAFPRAFQSPAKFGGDEAFSALDAYAAGIAGLHGRLDAVGLVLGRPVARAAALSDYIQNRLTTLPKPPIAAGARNYLAQGLRQGSPLLAPQAGLAAGAIFAPQPAPQQ